MLTTSVERLEGISVKLTVTVPAEQVDEAIDRAYKAVTKKVKIPGFRPGKAPRAMIDSMIGRDYILHEATEDVVNTTYPNALDAEDLRPIESPEMEELPAVEPGSDYTYVAEIDVRPELTLSDTKDFAVEVPGDEAPQQLIDAQIENARERFATLEPVEDRGVEESDFVLVSFVGTVDGEPYEGNVVDKYLYEMGRGMMPAEFDAGIIGAKPGDERTVEFEIPDTSSNPDFVGKTAGFAITVHEIKAKKLPEVDDDFAANMGFESVEEMQSDLKQRLDVQAKIEHGRAKERELRALAASRLVGDIPEAMSSSRAASMMRDFYSMLDTRQITIEQYLEGTGMTMEQVEADIAQQAEQSVREDLALEALFRELKMEVTSEDIDTELNEIAGATKSTPEEARKRWEDAGLMAVMREQIMHRKAVMWLIENAEVTISNAPFGGEETPTEGTKKTAPKKKTATKKKAAPKAKAETEEAAVEPAAEEADAEPVSEGEPAEKTEE